MTVRLKTRPSGIESVDFGREALIVRGHCGVARAVLLLEYAMTFSTKFRCRACGELTRAHDQKTCRALEEEAKIHGYPGCDYFLFDRREDHFIEMCPVLHGKCEICFGRKICFSCLKQISERLQLTNC